MKAGKLANIFLIAFFISGCSAELVTGIDENQANILLATLADNHIKAKKMRSGEEDKNSWAIFVRKKDLFKALQVLKENNLPAEKTLGVLEIFGNKGFLPTHTAERVLEEYSVNAELSKTLEQISGVVKARVHIARVRDEITGLEKPVSASVLINYINKGDTMPFREEDIKKIISGGIPNLRGEDVQVVTIPVSHSYSKTVQMNIPWSYHIILMACGIIVLLAGGVNLYLWGRWRSPGTKSDRREEETNVDNK